MKYTFFILCLILCIGCQENYTPKPRGYFRIEYPEKAYHQIETGCPFLFEIPDYSQMSLDKENGAKECWINIDFQSFNARLHLSYLPITAQSSLNQLTEDARTFAFKHTTKATAIDQKTIQQPEHQLYGLKYDIKGNTASNYQFFVTDSTKNYLRGALYFNEKPRIDSIQPVLEFIRADIDHLINTIRWK